MSTFTKTSAYHYACATLLLLVLDGDVLAHGLRLGQLRVEVLTDLYAERTPSEIFSLVAALCL